MSGNQNLGAAVPAVSTFFDGSYFSSDDEGRLHRSASADARNRPARSAPPWHYIYNATMVVLDLTMTLLATCLVLLAAPAAWRTLASLDHGIGITLILVCASWLISLVATHTYARHIMSEGNSLYIRLLNAAFMDFVIMCTLDYLLRLDIPRTLNVAVPVATVLLTIIERWLMRRALHRNRMKGEFNYPTVIIGSPDGIHRTIRQLRDSCGLGYAPIAVCPVESTGETVPAGCAQHLVAVPFTPADQEEAALKVLALNSHLPQTAKRLNARTVLIADTLTRDSETTRTLSLAVNSMGIELAVAASVADLGGAALHLCNDPSMPVLTTRLPQYSPFTRVLKRAIDIVLSLVAIILSAPIMAWASYRVRREDGGPALYKQPRIGIYGKPFTIYKFRSMRIDADTMDSSVAQDAGVELGATFKLKDDPRITRIGRFIRRTSIDEIPQFFNVLKGDMSMVGPRPQRQYEVDQYSSLYSTRLLVKPGITGPWQVSGRSDLTQEQSEFVDVSYIQHWSHTGDIAILCRTVAAVLKGTGSY